MNTRPAAPRFVTDIAVAFQFLTRLPVPQVTFAADGLARAVKFFPLVGLILGAGAALVHKVLVPHLSRPLCALAVLLYLVLITGCFHEDGLADVADSMGGWTAEKRLVILRDSRIGSYGSAALILSLGSRGVLLATLPLEHFTACVVSAHVLSRWSILPLSYYLRAAREGDGQGARVAQLTSSASFVTGTVFTLAVVGFLLRKAALAPVALALVVTALSGLFYMRKFGGVTGDCFGATNQLTEIAVYLCGVWH